MTQPHIAPLEMSEITDPELRSLIMACDALGVPDATLGRIIARVPSMAKGTLRMLLVSHADGSVDHRLKEIIRIRLARFVGDPYFAALRSKKALAAGLTEQDIAAGSADYESYAGFSEADKSAMRYAEQMFVDSRSVDASFYDDLRQHYSEAQIMELGSFIAFHYGAIRMARALGAVPRPAA